MNGETRRAKIVDCLVKSDKPVSATTLAKKYGVSRQIIVQDIALLRATGSPIVSHARGYMVEKNTAHTRVFKNIHSDEDAEKEMNIIVDAGGTIEDVFIFHKVYGTVHAPMGIKSRLQVQDFIADIKSGKSSLLKNVTSGYHYHTVTADSEETLDIIEAHLKEAGFLAPIQEYEPNELLENLNKDGGAHTKKPNSVQ